MQPAPINLAILSDQTLFRATLKAYLSQQQGLSIIIQASAIQELFGKLEVQPVDILIMDTFMGGMNGIDALKTIRKEYPAVKILVLSTNMAMEVISEVLDSGIHGYVSKSDEPEELLKAVRVISSGYIHQNTLLTKAYYLNGQKAIKNSLDESFSTLNERDKMMLRLIWEEKSSKDIANVLHLGVRSVEKLRQELKDKTGAKSTVGLLKYALRMKVIKGGFLHGSLDLANNNAGRV